MKTENNVLGRIEAMLFAAGEPVEAAKIAEILELDVRSEEHTSELQSRI